MIQDANKVTLSISAETEAFDEWVRSVRLLVSQIGFALDNYLASRLSPNDSLGAR